MAVRSSSRTSGGVAVGDQHLAHLVLGQADLEREPPQRVGVPDALPLGAEGEHQSLLHRVLHPVGLRQLHEPVGVEGVAAAHEDRRDFQAVAGGDLGGLPLRERSPPRAHPYFSARCVALSTVRCAGAVGSSSKLRQVTETSSRCSKAASAASKRRSPT